MFPYSLSLALVLDTQVERKRGIGVIGLSQLLGSDPGVDSRLANLSWLHFPAKMIGTTKVPIARICEDNCLVKNCVCRCLVGHPAR